MLLAAEGAAKDALPPALARVCKVARIERQQMTLAVPSAAYAARLRQLAPSVVQALAGGGWNLNEIKVRVQAGLLQNRTNPSGKEAIPLDDNALDAFDQLRGALQPGPLADAVLRLLKHHRR
ncbi:MAG: DciA family protein [Burkholderiaceae bacterium]